MSLSVKHLYKKLCTTLNMDKPQNMIEIERVLFVKNTYIKVIQMVKQSVSDLHDTFDTLEKNKKCPTTKLYNFNKKNIEINQKIKKEVKDILVNVDDIPTYFYAMIIMYFSNIRNEARRSKALFSIYKKKLIKQRAILSTKIGIKPTNFMLDCVVLRVSFDKNTIGEILDHSPDYYTYIGENEHKKIVGTSVNELFPGAFSKIHEGILKTRPKGFSNVSN